MLSPWVMEEIRAHPYRMWLIQAVGLLTFTLILVSRMPVYEYTTYVYPSTSPRVTSSQSKKAVESKQVGVSKRVMGRLSEVSGSRKRDTLPTRPVPSASPVATSSGPSAPSPVPSVPSVQPSAPTTAPVDLGPPSSEPNSGSESIPPATKPAVSVVSVPTS